MAATGWTGKSKAARLGPVMRCAVAALFACAIVLVLSPAALADTGAVSGTVTDASTGAPVSGEYVNAGGYSAVTDSSGHYTITGVPPAKYTVAFHGNPAVYQFYGNYVLQYYRGKPSPAAADKVIVSGGATASGIDAALQRAGGITGKVTAAATGGAVANVQVVVSAVSGPAAAYDGPPTTACTGSDGTYTVSGLPDGEYRVGFAVGTSGWAFCDRIPQNVLGQYYNDKSYPSGPDLVSVRSGTTTSGIDAALHAGGQITGKVTNSSTGRGFAYLPVVSFNASGRAVGWACTGQDGTYTIVGLNRGMYRVHFGFGAPAWPTLCSERSATYPPQSQYYSGKSSLAAGDAVSVTAGATTSGIDEDIKPYRQITGKVTDDVTGKPVGNVEVDASALGAASVSSSTCTQSDGTYSFFDLPAGEYLVGFVGYRSRSQRPLCGAGARVYLPQYYNGKSRRAAADPVIVSEDGTASGIDAALHLGGQITGQVTDASTGASAQKVQVVVYNETGQIVAWDCTAADGTYTVSGLSRGHYRVGFAIRGYYRGACGGIPQSYPAQYFRGKWSLASADIVSVAAGVTTSGVDQALAYAPVFVYSGPAPGFTQSFTDFGTATGRSIETSGVFPSELMHYRCVILNVDATPFTSEQVAALSSYVNGGGTLLAIGEAGEIWFSDADMTMNALATSLGAHMSLNRDAVDRYFHTTTNVDPSPLTAGVQSIEYAYPSTLSVWGPAETLVRTQTESGSEPIIAAESIGRGLFLLFGDSNVLADDSNTGYTQQNNGRLARNLCGS